MVTSTPADRGRRRFLMGAAGLAAAPLVAGLAAGCTSAEPSSQPRTAAATAWTR